MTYREFYNAVIEGTITEDMVEFAKGAVEKLDARNAKRAERPSKKAIENEPIKAKIAEILTDTPQTASEIATKVEISVQKASALLRQMDTKVCDVKIKGKGTQKGYSL